MTIDLTIDGALFAVEKIHITDDCPTRGDEAMSENRISARYRSSPRPGRITVRVPGRDTATEHTVEWHDALKLLDELTAAIRAANNCDRCGQVDVGQQGEYPCSLCGLPTVHDQLLDVSACNCAACAADKASAGKAVPS